MTQKRDGGALVDNVPVQWSVLAAITLFASTMMDCMDKPGGKPDRIGLLRNLAAPGS